MVVGGAPALEEHPWHRMPPLPPFPSEEERSKQTNVVWSSCDPVWDEALLFRDVCAASGGRVVWVGG